MRRYRLGVDSPTRFEYGLELVEGLRAFPATAALAPGFEQLNDELDASYEARRDRRKSLMKARAALRVREYQTDQVIRSLSRAAEIADGGRRGLLHEALFPEGLSPVVAPSGARQAKPTEELISRFGKTRVAGVEPLRAEWQPKLQAALADLKDAIGVYAAAQQAHRDAFGDELSLREEHERSIDKLMGLVRSQFPKDRRRQDVIFPRVAAGAEEESSEIEEDAAEDTTEDTDGE
jgi:hypothetical protein